jgi:hypothetical protein
LVISTLIKCILSSCDSLYINYQLFSQRASSHRLQYYTININWFFGFCLSAYPKSSPFKVFISVIQWFNNIYCKAEKRRICMLMLYQTATFLLLSLQTRPASFFFFDLFWIEFCTILFTCDFINTKYIFILYFVLKCLRSLSYTLCCFQMRIFTSSY